MGIEANAMKIRKLLSRLVYEAIAKHLPASTSFAGGGDPALQSVDCSRIYFFVRKKREH